MRLVRHLALAVGLGLITASAVSAEEVAYEPDPGPIYNGWRLPFSPPHVVKPSFHGGRPFGYRPMPSKEKEACYRCGYPYGAAGSVWHPYVRSPRDFFMQDR